VALPAGVEPIRPRRPIRRLNHFLVESALMTALAEEGSISEVAAELDVDPSTLARHEDLYRHLRGRAQERSRKRQAAAHMTAVAQAEPVLLSLVRSGRTPSLRNASEMTGQTWRPSQLRAIALQTMRMQLGGRHLQSSCKASNVSDAFRELVASAVGRLTMPVVDGQLPLQV
jgi:transposase-like protein